MGHTIASDQEATNILFPCRYWAFFLFSKVISNPLPSSTKRMLRHLRPDASAYRHMAPNMITVIDATTRWHYPCCRTLYASAKSTTLSHSKGSFLFFGLSPNFLIAAFRARHAAGHRVGS